jgi:hypothetical protein
MGGNLTHKFFQEKFAANHIPVAQDINPHPSISLWLTALIKFSLLSVELQGFKSLACHTSLFNM